MNVHNYLIFNMIHKFKYRILLLIFVLGANCARADEGMWLINLIHQNIKAMQGLGCKLSADEIYSTSKPSLKDAVVQFDDGSCTGVLVSEQGLFITNHHCGIDAVQSLSNIDNNLIQNGFWSKNKQDEIPIPGKTALVLLSVEDVTAQIQAAADPSLPNEQYFHLLDMAMQDKADKVAQLTGNYVVIKPFFDYNSFYLFQYARYLDIRLVAVPPASIGNFGGDIDNWHWPRHTGDFCMFRIYTAPDGKPAEHSTSNIPLKPKKFLQISLDGVNEGDFTMLIGFPGTTHRYATSYEALHYRDVVAPWKREVWGPQISMLKKAQAANPAVKLDYVDKHDYLVNFYQKDTWQAESMFRYNVVERLAARQDSLILWANLSPSIRSRYMSSLPIIQNFYQTARTNKWEEVQGALLSLVFYPVDVYQNVNECDQLLAAILAQGVPYNPLCFWKKDAIRREVKKVKKKLPSIFEHYHVVPDINLYMVSMGNLFKNIGDCPNVPIINELKHQPDFEHTYPYYVDNFYKKSYFTSPGNLNRLLKNPYRDSLVQDPLLALYFNYRMLWDSINGQFLNAELNLKKASQLFTRGLLEMNPEHLHYPDANSTMRLNYGKVAGYKPYDGIYYKPFTTLDGVLEKVNPSNELLQIDLRLYELWKNKDYGRYGKQGKMGVCFLTDNDITGGNSGSPVLNADGQLVGLAFDGNSEAMACDFIYEPDMQRSIVVDIRYVMFILDKYAKAQNIVDELVVCN